MYIQYDIKQYFEGKKLKLLLFGNEIGGWGWGHTNDVFTYPGQITKTYI